MIDRPVLQERPGPACCFPAHGLRGEVILLMLVLAVMAAGCAGGASSRQTAPEPSGPAATTVNGSGLPVANLAPKSDMKSRLSLDDRRLLAEARARGDAEVILLIAAAPGRAGEVVTAIEGLGGVVRSFDKDLHYVSAVVPTGEVEAVAALGGVQAVNLDDEIPVRDPRP
jgi:hypothetical protein